MEPVPDAGEQQLNESLANVDKNMSPMGGNRGMTAAG